MVELGGGGSLARQNTKRLQEDVLVESSYDPQYHHLLIDHPRKRRASDADNESPRRESTTTTSLGGSPISVAFPSSLTSSSTGTRHSTGLPPPSSYSSNTHEEDDVGTFSRETSSEMSGSMELLDPKQDGEELDSIDLAPTDFLHHHADDADLSCCSRSRTESSYVRPEELPPAQVCYFLSKNSFFCLLSLTPYFTHILLLEHL